MIALGPESLDLLVRFSTNSILIGPTFDNYPTQLTRAAYEGQGASSVYYQTMKCIRMSLHSLFLIVMLKILGRLLLAW